MNNLSTGNTFDSIDAKKLIEKLLNDGDELPVFERGQIYLALSRKMDDEFVEDFLFKQLTDSNNMKTVAMGTFSLSMVIALGIVDNGSKENHVKLKNEIKKLPDVQENDFMSYLSKEGMQL